LAASHALVARGYLDFDAETEEKWLEPGLESVIRPMLQNDFSLRCSKATEAGEEILTLYVSTEALVRHHLQRSVVSIVEMLPNRQIAEEQLMTFFELSADDGRGDLIATIPAGLLESLRRNALNEAVQEAKSELIKYGIPESAATAIIEDLQRSAYRGSVVQLKLEDDRTISDKGFLLLKGQERTWLFVIEGGEDPTMFIYPGSREVFQRQLDSLDFSS
jgi:hypothetical protein